MLFQSFAFLGIEWEVSEKLAKDLECYVATLSGINLKSVNKARYSLFEQRYSNKQKYLLILLKLTNYLAKNVKITSDCFFFLTFLLMIQIGQSS